MKTSNITWALIDCPRLQSWSKMGQFHDYWCNCLEDWQGLLISRQPKFHPGLRGNPRRNGRYPPSCAAKLSAGRYKRFAFYMFELIWANVLKDTPWMCPPALKIYLRSKIFTLTYFQSYIISNPGGRSMEVVGRQSADLMRRGCQKNGRCILWYHIFVPPLDLQKTSQMLCWVDSRIHQICK